MFFIQGSQSQFVIFPPYGGTMLEYNMSEYMCKVTKNRETSSWNFYKRLLFKIDFTPGILPLRPCALH